MNERIRELAEQAGSTHKQNLGVYQFFSDELNNFAESIIRECCQLVEDTPGVAWNDIELIIETIRENFGVKR